MICFMHLVVAVAFETVFVALGSTTALLAYAELVRAAVVVRIVVAIALAVVVADVVVASPCCILFIWYIISLSVPIILAPIRSTLPFAQQGNDQRTSQLPQWIGVVDEKTSIHLPAARQ